MRQRQFYRELEKYHSWNSTMNVLDASFFAVAFACILPTVTVVAYLKHYTDSRFILNLPVFIANFFFATAPFIASFFAGRIKRKKRAMVIGGLFHRFFWIPVVIVVWKLSDARPGVLLPAFFITYSLFYLAWGSTGIFWREVIGRTLHPDKLSSAMGLRESISNVVGFGMSFVVMYILANIAFPNNFLLLNIIAMVFLWACLIFLAKMKEATYEGTHQEPPVRHFKKIISLPFTDRALGWYLVFMMFSYGTHFIGGLYTSEAIDRFGSGINPDKLAGIINVVMLCSVSLFAVVNGKIYDKAGKFWGFLPVIIASTLVPLWAMAAGNLVSFLGVFAVLGIIRNSWFMELATVLALAPPERRHEYIAVIALAKVFPIALYTNAGGYLADTFSPSVTFTASSLCCFIGLLVLVFKLRPIWMKQAEKI